MGIFNRSTDKKNKKSFFDLSDGQYNAADSYGVINEEQTPRNRSLKRRKLLTMILTVIFGAALFGVIASVTFKLTSDLMDGGDEKLPVNVGTNVTPSITKPVEPILDPTAFQALESVYAGVRATANALNPCIAEVAAVSYVTDPVFGTKTAESRTFFGIVFGYNKVDYLILVRNDALDKSYENLQVSFSRVGGVEARVVQRNEEINLAVLAVKGKEMSEYDREGISVVPYGDSAKCEIGTALVAIGYMNGRSRSVDLGFITSDKETVYIRDSSLELMETNMSLNEGAFGVALNSDGEVVGIITESFGESNCVRAITINSISNLLYDMLNDRKKVTFGAMLSDMNRATREKLGIKNGILITEIFDDTVADEAGFRKGDILLKLGDAELFYVSQFNTLLRQSEGAGTMTIVYRRGSTEYKAEVKVRME